MTNTLLNDRFWHRSRTNVIQRTDLESKDATDCANLTSVNDLNHRTRTCLNNFAESVSFDTVEPLWATTSRRRPPLLSDHFVNSFLTSQSNTVINTSHKHPPLVSDHDHLWGFRFGLFFCFFTSGKRPPQRSIRLHCSQFSTNAT